MKVKKKIAVWCALFALMVALVPTRSARADEVENSVEYATVVAKSILENDELMEIINTHGYIFGYSAEIGDYILCYYPDGSVGCFVGADNWETYRFHAFTAYGGTRLFSYDYIYDGGNWTFRGTGAELKSDGRYWPSVYACSCNSILSRDGTVNIKEDISTIEDFVGGFNFAEWCSDAGLNCQASSNESASVIPYSYNDYWHIVRKTSSGKWLLTTIGSTLGQAKMSLRLSEGNGSLVINEFSGDDSFTLSVRQYEYDADGWKVRSYNTYDYDDMTSGLLTLEAGTGIDDTRVIAYTSIDIYSSDGLAVVVPASTEYTEPTIPESPSEEITPTPTNAPSGGGIGGGTRPEVTPAISAGQATVTKNRSAIYEEPSSTSQVQHYLYSGALVYVVEECGEDWYCVRYEVGGLSCTGYVARENVAYDVENGFASPDVAGGYEMQISDLLGMIGAVPLMIGSVFAFLPPWCLAIVGVAFTSLIGLIVWKVARG